VGLWAHTCKSMTEFSGALFKSSSRPSKSSPRLEFDQYLYSLSSLNPALGNMDLWLSGNDRISNF
jgi:hypothetical protein